MATREQLAFLTLPRVPVERVTVDQNHGLADPVILVVDLDRGVVLGSNSDTGHAHSSLVASADAVMAAACAAGSSVAPMKSLVACLVRGSGG
jgi:hypothetical protein